MPITLDQSPKQSCGEVFLDCKLGLRVGAGNHKAWQKMVKSIKNIRRQEDRTYGKEQIQVIISL